jgi:hypothetical protein
VQALPSIAGDIGRVIAGMPSGAGAAQAEDFARYQRSIPPSDVSPLTAFHGTPHTFDPTPANPLGEFRAAKIGSGEGAQAFGYGIYFAESPGVAKVYQTDLSRNLWKQNPPDDPVASAALERFNGDIQYAKDILKEQVAVLRENFSPNFAAAERGLIALENYKPPTGSLYTVDIPDNMVEKMLDWDKPLSDQPKTVQDALEKAGLWSPDPSDTGRTLYELLVRKNSTKMFEGGKDRATSQYLSSIGIPGIRYLDRSSRAAGEGTRNIVVFPGEESKVKILKRE